MPKRVIDGEGIWTSEKLLRVQARFRGEYPWLLPNALANGVCEIDSRRIWSRCYAYCREDFQLADVEQMLDAFDAAGMLFRWTADGKRWGFFIGIDKVGRLPKPSRLARRHESVGPTPPADQLADYIQKTSAGPLADHQRTTGAPMVSLGFGLGSGLGSGTGIGTDEKPLPRKKHAAGVSDTRFALFVEDLKSYWDDKNPGVAFPFNNSDGSALKKFLQENPNFTREQFQRCLSNRAASDALHCERPRVILPNLLRYVHCPLDRYNRPRTEAVSHSLSDLNYHDGVPTRVLASNHQEAR